MTETQATKETPESRRQGEAQSYWSLALRDFRRNKLAMAGLLLIFLVVTSAVHVPFLANHLPLYVSAVIVDDYENEMFLAMEAMDKLAKPGADSAQVSAALAELEQRRITMAEHLGTADAASLDSIMASARQAASAADRADAVAQAKSKFEAAFFDRTPELLPRKSYPAFRSLTIFELWFMAAYWCVLLFALPLRRFIKGFLPFVVAVAIPATAFSYIVREVWTPITDTRNYRKITTDPAFKGEVIRALVPFGENENILERSRKPPMFAAPTIEPKVGQPYPNPHLLGTDTNGRDVLARMIYGSRVAMLIGIFAVMLYTSIGIVIGACAGFFRGKVDLIVSRLIEVVICFPFLMVILSVQAFLSPKIQNIIITLGVLSWTTVARLQRGEFLRLVNMDFVNAVRALGGSNARIIFLHILPNAMGPILVLISFGIAGSILTESALSFLGFGVPQPMASWGDLLNNSRSDPQGLWWLTLFPGIAIFMTVTCFNLIGEGVRDALDPRRDR